jgi:hypothetical protein
MTVQVRYRCDHVGQGWRCPAVVQGRDGVTGDKVLDEALAAGWTVRRRRDADRLEHVCPTHSRGQA